MSLIKNISGEDRIVPSLGGRLVLAGQAVEVDEEHVDAFTCQTTNWELAEPAKKKRSTDRTEVQA